MLQVGSGKSSILAALLGELQPFVGGVGVQAGDGAQDVGGAGPILHGRAAYCSQVPWVVAGSIRVRSPLRTVSWSMCRAQAACVEDKLLPDLGSCSKSVGHLCC